MGFKKHNGLVAPLDRVNVDTDAIIPKQFLKRIERTGYGQFLFYDWKYDNEGQLDENFVLNQSRYEGTSILLGRDNFGCGSSREHAPWALNDFGIKVIIAPSFADIFYNNCFKNGILPLTTSPSNVNKLFEKAKNEEGYHLDVDVINQLVSDKNDIRFTFELEENQKQRLVEGVDDIEMTMRNEKHIDKFEVSRSSWLTPNVQERKTL